MKPEDLSPMMRTLPDEELISPVEPPAVANDGPDGEALEDNDGPEDDGDRAGEL